MVIKRVGPVSCAKIAAILYALIGIVIGIAVSLISMAGAFGSNLSSYSGLAAVVGGGAIVAFPIFYAVLGFVGALIAAGLYNLAAGLLGGIQIDVE